MPMKKRLFRKCAKRFVAGLLVANMILTVSPVNMLEGVFSFGSTIVAAAEYVVGNATYNYTERADGTIMIVNYSGTDTSLIIPSTIDGKKVTGIGEYAFSSCNTLVSVTIPEGVEVIKFGAFHMCTALSEIIIPDSVTTIGGYAFSQTAIRTINLPESITEIDGHTFLGCTNLESIQLPSNITTIGGNAFEDCSSLSAITIPESVHTIQSYAFKGTALTSVTIPASVTNMASDVFIYCDKLESIEVAEDNANYKSVNGVLYSEDGTNLYSVPAGRSGEYVVADGVTDVMQDSFRGCAKLTSVVMPDSVKYIGMYAFRDCTALEAVDISNNVQHISESAFENCISLKSVTLPAALRSMNDYIFRNCTSLTDINVAEGNTTYKSRDGVLFNIEGGELVEYPKGRTGVYTVPEYVKSIATEAFSGCMGLTDVVIPDTVERIDNYAFAGCSLTSITLTNDDMKVSVRAFGWNSTNVPDINYNFIFKGNKGGLAESLAKNNFCKFETVDGTYSKDYGTVVEGYESSLANYDAIEAYLNEYYIEKYPAIGLANDYGTDNDRAFFKNIASEAIAEYSSVSAPLALYNWMNANITIDKSHNYSGELGYPMDVYNFRSADCLGNALLLRELLRSADIPAVVLFGYVNNFDVYSEKYMLTADRTEHAWVLAYWEDKWISLDSGMNIVCDTKEELCKEYYVTMVDDYIVIYHDMYNFNIDLASMGVVYKDGIYSSYDKGDIYYDWLNGCGTHVSPEDIFFEWKKLDGATYVSDDSEVIRVPGKEGLVKYGSDIYYRKGSSAIATRTFKDIDGKLVWFNQNGLAFDITSLQGRYRTYKGRPVVEKGTTFSLKALIQDYEKTEIKWTSDNEDVATVDSNGNVTAVGNGSVWIKGNDWYTFELYVDGSVTGITLPEKIELKVNQSITLDAVIEGDSEIFSNILWDLADETVANLIMTDGTGEISVFAEKEGVSELTATVGGNSGLSAKCTVIVTSDEVDIKGDFDGEGVYIEYPSGVVDDKVTLIVKPIGKDHKDYEDIKPLEDVEFIAYDINLTDENNVKVQPNGKLKVMVPCPEGYEVGKCRVYYVNDEGKYVNMKAQYIGGFLVFETNHFSTYMITSDELTEDVVEEPKFIYGDANSDGKVDVADGVVLKKHLAGYKDMDISLSACDVNADGNVDVSDAVKLMKKLAGYYEVLGAA